MDVYHELHGSEKAKKVEKLCIALIGDHCI